jgi:hypothetical protein
MALPAVRRPSSFPSLVLTSAIALASVSLLWEPNASLAKPLGPLKASTQAASVDLNAGPGCSLTKGGWSCAPERADACALTKGGRTCLPADGARDRFL